MLDASSPCLLTQPKVVNGVNVPAMMETIAAIKDNAAMAKFNFRATNKWLGGDKNRSTIQEFSGALQEHRVDGRPFVYDNGEAEVLLGHDKAPNPAEWMLHALVGCLTTSIAYHAALRCIEIRAIDSEIDGDIDLRGFLGISNKVRKGYSEIRVTMRVATLATRESIEALARMSPMLDVVSRSAPVKLTIETR
jgi:uncharacterized OsmC-like protein